jgi:hypothetical protein
METRKEEFDYLNSNLSEGFGKKIVVRSGEMFVKEVRERARLLYNLKFAPDDAVARIQQNLAWEFDDGWKNSKPEVFGQIKQIVADLYGHMQNKLD